MKGRCIQKKTCHMLLRYEIRMKILLQGVKKLTAYIRSKQTLEEKKLNWTIRDDQSFWSAQNTD